MNEVYEEIAERIRGEATDLERLVQRSSTAWLHFERSESDREIYLDSVALNLHGF